MPFLITGRQGSRIDEIEFIADDGSVFGPYGGNGGGPWVSARPGCKLSYLSGSSGDRLDSIILHYECEALIEN